MTAWNRQDRNHQFLHGSCALNVNTLELNMSISDLTSLSCRAKTRQKICHCPNNTLHCTLTEDLQLKWMNTIQIYSQGLRAQPKFSRWMPAERLRGIHKKEPFLFLPSHLFFSPRLLFLFFHLPWTFLLLGTAKMISCQQSAPGQISFELVRADLSHDGQYPGLAMRCALAGETCITACIIPQMGAMSSQRL